MNEVIVQMKVMKPAYWAGAGTLIQFYDPGGNGLVRLAVPGGVSDSGLLRAELADIAGTLLAQGGVLLCNTGAIQTLTVHVKIANTGGVFQVSVDGVQGLNYLGDTQLGSSNVIATVRIGCVGSLGAINDMYFDDVGIYAVYPVPSTVFYDDFEAGNFNLWDAVEGSVQCLSGGHVSGTYAAYVTTGTPPMYLGKNLPVEALTSNVFPSALLPLPVAADFVDGRDAPALRSRKEMGYLQVRPAFTKVRRTFRVKYILDWDQRVIMENFFDALGWGGNSFMYTHPDARDGLAREMVMLDDNPQFVLIPESPKRYSITFNLMEV